MTTLEEPNPFAPGQIAATDTLSLDAWAKLLQVTRQAVDKRVDGAEDPETGAVSARFAALPAEWQERLLALALEKGARSAGELRSIVARQTQYQPPRPYMSYPPASRKRAEDYWTAFRVYWEREAEGRMVAIKAAVAAHAAARKAEQPDYVPSEHAEKQFRRIRDVVEQRGGAAAPAAAYLDGKSEPKGKKMILPDELISWLGGKLTDSAHGVRSVSDVHREACELWQQGYEVPGLGIREKAEVFPFSVNQFRAVAPGNVARQLAGRGKFWAKTHKLLAAPPLDWSNVEPMRIIMCDDKVLDLEVQSDDGREVFRPSIYIAYDAGTRRILSYSARPGGQPRKLDVEGLHASVLMQHGMGGPQAGFATRFIYERGTVALDAKWDAIFERMWPGSIVISRTGMIGGATAGGDWVQKGSGNFFGKGVIEAAMWALDNYLKRMPGATGNHRENQPATLGDTTLTRERIANSAKQGHKPTRSLIEESLCTAAMAQMINFAETGELVGAYEASKRTGIQGKLLYWTQFVALLGELFRAFNNRRGHAMQGFGKVRVEAPAATGAVWNLVSESPNDKAERMFAEMREQGRSLVKPIAADATVMMHSIRRVTLSANGCKLKVGDWDELHFWHEDSQAQVDAANVLGGKKTYLALLNPVQPTALYLLDVPPGRVPTIATELPADVEPRLLEVLPLYNAPSAVDQAALNRRRDAVARFNAKLGREAVQVVNGLLAERTEEREAIRDRLEPLQATIMAARAPAGGQPTELPRGSRLGAQMTAAEVMLANAVVRQGETRREAQTDAQAQLAAFQAAHATTTAPAEEERELDPI